MLSCHYNEDVLPVLICPQALVHRHSVVQHGGVHASAVASCSIQKSVKRLDQCELTCLEE